MTKCGVRISTPAENAISNCCVESRLFLESMKPGAYAEIFFRPFARRRLIIRRPVGVLIRTRNPCVIARFLFFG